MSAIVDVSQEDEITLDKVCWDIIDNYFYNVSHYISKNQIDSYNMFADEQIGKTIRQFNPIQLVYEHTENKVFEIDIIIGGSVAESGNELVNDGSSIKLGKPIIHEKYLGKDEDGNEIFLTRNKQLYPNEARLKNLTYTMAVYTDIHILYKLVNSLDNSIIKTELKTIPEKLLGRIPLMLHSKACILSSIPQANLRDFGECPYDQGGYFIIDGKEKVITAQTRQVENKIYIYKRKADDKDDYQAEIRSTPEDKLQPARITNVYLKKPEQDKDKINTNKENLLFVGIPNIKEQIPIFIIFRALGVTSDREILEYIVGDIETELGGRLANMLYDNILISSEVRTQVDAIRYLQNCIRSFHSLKKENIYEIDDEGEPVEDRFNMDLAKVKYLDKLKEKEEIEFTYIYDILYNYFLPHMGTTNLVEKAGFLGYMTNRLLLTKLNVLEPTDRDNYMYKRIDISGYLVATIFRDLYFRVKNQLFYECNKNYAKGKEKKHWTDDNIAELIDENNIDLLYDQSIMTDGFKYAFKNCWGLKNAPCKEGVVQDLNRLTYLGMISHLRRVVTPLSASSKLRGPHMLHLSTYGILCPVETPDGANVGVKTNLALMTDVTFGSHSSAVYHALLDNHLILLSNVNIEYANKKVLTRVFLNGRLAGYHDKPNLLVNRMRLLRRNALINVYTSIAWYIDRNEILISTDSGRSCHPMIIVGRNNKLAIKPHHLANILSGKLRWKSLVGGREDWDQYDNKYYPSTKTDEELDLSGGVIEYIDTEEANTMLIAMNQSELINNSTSVRFTHCEIHPSIMFGIMGSIIPYVGTNQLPRNLYSCGQGKQAIGVYASNYKNRMDTKTQVLYYPQKPIVQNRISKHLYNNTLPYGMNAIIAVGCYTGYNQDDSIIFNRSSLDRGLFRSIKFRTYAIREEQSEMTKLKSKICNPILIGAPGSGIVVRNLKPGDFTKLDENGIVREGLKVNDSDIVVGKVIMTNEVDENGNKIYLDDSEYVRRAESGIVDKVFYSYDNNNYLFVKVRLRKEKKPELGDKFASRAGQKGIMGMMLNEVDVPYTKHGVRPDMIINPQAFPKRMTISQFVEAQQTKQCSLLGIFGDASPFQDIPLDKMGDVLESLGFERTGCEKLYNGMTGEMLEHEIFIGPTYYERLQHQVEDKMHSRDVGSVTMLSKQPTGGRSIGGGLRIGEMERDALLSHGIAGFLKESMTDRSDVTEVYICNGCGFIGMVNQEKKIFNCYSCNSSQITYKNNKLHKHQIETSTNSFSKLQIPYAMKLLTQELEAMSVAPRIITTENSKRWKHIDKFSNNVEMNTKLEAIFEKTDGADDKYYVKKGSNLDFHFRRYQNYIKTLLIFGAYAITVPSTPHNAPHLLDLSVGRGGDLNKWINANYEYILGLDLNPSNLTGEDDSLKIRIEKAKDNADYADFFSKSKIEYGVSNTCRYFYNGDSFVDTTPSNQIKLKQIITERGLHSFDVVSCQFSIHYCFDSILSVQNVLRNIADSLREGGVVIITTMNGKLVHKRLLKDGGHSKFYGYSGKSKQLLYSIRKNYSLDDDELPDDESSLGKQIMVKIGTTDQEFAEFLVSPTLLINQARLFGLKFSETYKFQRAFPQLMLSSASLTRFIDTHALYNKHADNLFNNADYRDMLDFGDLFFYYVFVKDTGEIVATNDREECVEISKQLANKKIESTNTIDILYHRQNYGKFNFTLNPGLDKITLPRELKSYLDNQLNVFTDGSGNNNKFKADDLIESIEALSKHTNSVIYCYIKNGEIVSYSPYYKLNNEDKVYHSYLNNEYLNILQKNLERYRYYPETALVPVETDVNLWNVETCRVNTSIYKWNDVYYRVIYHMLSTLCKERPNIPDVELVINLSDKPVEIPIKNAVVLSLSKNVVVENKNNLAIPTPFDWWCATELLTTSSNGCHNAYLDFKGAVSSLPEWNTRNDVIVWRGSTEGCGYTPETNERLRALNFIVKSDMYKKGDVDAKITRWDTNLNTNNEDGEAGFTRGYRSNNQDLTLTDFALPYRDMFEDRTATGNMAELSKYKYILHIDGYGASLKYPYLMTLGSVIIRLDNVEKLWCEDMLVPFHFSDGGHTRVKPDVLRRADHILIKTIKDLPYVLQWCRTHQAECNQIARNAQELATNHLLNKDLLLNYLEYAIKKIHLRYDRSINYNDKSIIMDVAKEHNKKLVETKSIKVNSKISKIINDNKITLEFYFLVVDIDIKHGFNTDIVTFKGYADEANKFIEFIENLSEWSMWYKSVSNNIYNDIENAQQKLESHFDVYIDLVSDKKEIIVFGSKENIKAFREYIDASQDHLPIITWYRERELTLKLDLYSIRQDQLSALKRVAIVILASDYDNTISPESLSDNRGKNLVDRYGDILDLMRDNYVDYQMYYVKQTTNTKIRNIPREIVFDMEKGVLKTNYIGLLKGINNIIPKEYNHLLVLDNKTGFLELKDLENLLSLAQEINVIGNHVIMVNDRNYINRLPVHLFGCELNKIQKLGLDFVESFNDEREVEKKFGYVGHINIPGETCELGELELGYIKSNINNTMVDGFFSVERFSILDNLQRPVNTMHYFELDMTPNAISPILASQKIPEFNAEVKNKLDWVSAYVKVFDPSVSIKTSKNNIVISGFSQDITAFYKNLAQAVEYVLMMKFAQIVQINVIETGDSIIYNILDVDTPPVRKTSVLDILPYYTIGHKYYVRNITQEIIEDFQAVITKLRNSHPIDKSIALPTKLDKSLYIYVARIGNIVIYYHTKNDLLVIFNLVLKKFVDELPEELSELDLNILQVLFKDRNDAVLSLVISRDNMSRLRFVTDPLSINKLIVPDLTKYIKKETAYFAEPESQSKPVNKYTQNILQLEPSIQDYGEKYAGYVD